MVPLTRRRLLQGSVALLTGFAGCNESLSGTATESGSVPRREDTGPVPDYVVLRTPDSEPPVWFLDEDADAAADETAPETRPERARQRGFVADAADAERLRFADVDGADEAREFVADTDYDAETVYVESRSIRQCLTLELCNVTWSASDVETDYGSNYRDADEACSADERDAVTVLIRIPEALDPDRVRSSGSSWSSTGCRSERPPARDGTTEAPDFGPKSAANATETAEDER